MKEKRNFVHIGLGKAASTFLQGAVFGNLPINYLGKNGKNTEYNKLIGNLATENSLVYQDNALKDLLEVNLEEYPLLLSEELFAAYTFIDPYIIANRLKSTFGEDLQVILITRNVEDWLNSQYMFRLEMGQPDVLAGPTAWAKTALTKQRIGNPLLQVFYSNLYDIYSSVFSSNNITVLPYELLKSDPAKFYSVLDELFEFEEGTYSQSIKEEKNTKYKKRITQEHYDFILTLISNVKDDEEKSTSLIEIGVDIPWNRNSFNTLRKYRRDLFAKIISSAMPGSKPAKVVFDKDLIDEIGSLNYKLDMEVFQKYGVSSKAKEA